MSARAWRRVGLAAALVVGLVALWRMAAPDRSGDDAGPVSSPHEEPPPPTLRGTAPAESGAEAPSVAVPRPSLPDIAIVGRVLRSDGGPPPTARFLIFDAAMGQLVASGPVSSDGRFEAQVRRDDSTLSVWPSTVEVLVTCPGLGRVEGTYDVPEEGPVEALLTLAVHPLLHGTVTDSQGRSIPHLRMIWIPRGFGYSLDWEDADPVEKPARWALSRHPPWCVSDAEGRFAVAGVDLRELMPLSLLHAWDVHAPDGAVGTLADPIRVIARRRTGVVAHVVDDVSGDSIREADGWCIVRANGRVLIRGSMSGRQGELRQLVQAPAEAIRSGEAEILIMAPGYLPHRDRIELGEDPWPATIEVRLAPATGSLAPRRVEIDHEGLDRFMERAFVMVQRILRVGEGNEAVQVEQMLDISTVQHLQPGRHELIFFADTTTSFSRLAPWRVEVVVPEEGEAEVRVAPPRVGTLRLVVRGDRHVGLSSIGVVAPSGQESHLHTVRATRGEIMLRGVPAGRCTVQLHRPFGAGGVERYAEVKVDVAEGTETVLTLE